MTRARDLGLGCGGLPPGPRNTVADVAGVRVGHVTLVREDVRTGVTAIVPPGKNLFADKLLATADANQADREIGRRMPTVNPACWNAMADI